MFLKFPKDDSRTAWTRHIKNKMLFYGLGEQRIRRIMQSPDRKEEGIAPNTIAVMQRSKTKKKPEEIWVMYQKINNNKQKTSNNKRINSTLLLVNRPSFLMISAWRYPGITKPGTPVPIPDDILEALGKGIS